MKQTFYFYDLETTGVNARWCRIMQFAGQRVDEALKPIGKPDNVLVKLSDDIVPEPEAILITGITPQQTLRDGISEAEFAKWLMTQVATPGTCMVGFNSIRFDDEFLRHLLWRNFYDPYEREWLDGRSRWDVIDLVRMMRALRPEGLEWPTDKDGKATNRLEELAKANKLDHAKAHDAESDVLVTLELTQLVRAKQPSLYEHLLGMRDKKKAGALLDYRQAQPLVHTSDMISSDFAKTSVVIPIAPHPQNQNAVLVYDLRYDPTPFGSLDSDELARLAFTGYKELQEQGEARLPVKAVHANKSPAIAPLGVLNDESQARIKLNLDQVEKNRQKLAAQKGFGQRVFTAWQREALPPIADPEGALYGGGFLDDYDRRLINEVRSRGSELADYQPDFHDERLAPLLLRYKARNFPKSLTQDEQTAWEAYRRTRLMEDPLPITLKQYFSRLQKLAATPELSAQSQYLLEELQLYGESIVPVEESFA